MKLPSRTEALGLAAAVLALWAFWRGRPAPDPAPLVVHRMLPPRVVDRDLPPVKETLLRSIIWTTSTPRLLETSTPQRLPLVTGFCAAAGTDAPGPDTAVARGTARAPRGPLLLTASRVTGRELTVFGLYGDGSAYRSVTDLRRRHAGLEVRADGDSLVVHEARGLFGLDLRVGLQAGVGVGLLSHRPDGWVGVGGVLGF